jgi:hypothetical protein
VRRERACLDQLSMTTSELLGLRAGLSGPPLSRSEVASQLGLSGRRAARIERSGLRALHAACGGSTGSGGNASSRAVPARLVSLATGAPALQPAVYLPASSAPDLRPTGDLAHPPAGQQGVEGATASSPPPSAAGPVQATATSAALGKDAAGNSVLPLVLAFCLAALAALFLVGLRRRAVANQRGGATITPAVAALPPGRERLAPGAGARTAPDRGGDPAAGQRAGALTAPTRGAEAAGAAAATAKAGDEPAHDAAPAQDAAPTHEVAPADHGGVAREAAPTHETSSPRETGWVGPSADRATETASPDSQATPGGSARDRVTRSASVVASSLVSFAVRELVRRRRRR